jgi:hypothetical protein
MKSIIKKILEEETKNLKLNDIILKDLLNTFNKNTMIKTDTTEGMLLDSVWMPIREGDFYRWDQLLIMVETFLIPHINETYNLNIEQNNEIILKWLREMYGDGDYPLPGDTIEMIEMDGDDPDPILPGTKGIVGDIKSHTLPNNHIKWEEHIEVNWENGRTLKVLLPVDKIKIINKNS